MYSHSYLPLQWNGEQPMEFWFGAAEALGIMVLRNKNKERDPNLSQPLDLNLLHNSLPYCLFGYPVSSPYRVLVWSSRSFVNVAFITNNGFQEKI